MTLLIGAVIPEYDFHIFRNIPLKRFRKVLIDDFLTGMKRLESTFYSKN